MNSWSSRCRAIAFICLVAPLALFSAGCGGYTYIQPSTRSYATTAASLKQAAGSSTVTYGAAVKQIEIANDPNFADLVAGQVNLIVPENELKWETTEPAPGQYNFGPADNLFAFAQQHGLKFRGHCLVWHQQLPDWVSSESGTQFQQDFIDHIQQEVSHYAGQVQSWDVVNEAIEPGDGKIYGLRDNIFYKRLGSSYVDQAFRIAAAADPNAVLVYNEAGLEYDNSDGDARRADVLKLLTHLKQSGVPVHALGIQAHLAAVKKNEFNAEKFTAFLDAVSALGLRIFITELDVADNGIIPDPVVRDQIVGDTYYEFLRAAFAHGKIDTVVTWGLSDRYSWLSEWKPRGDGKPVRPLHFDADYTPTSAFGAIAQNFDPGSAVGASTAKTF